MRSIKKKQIFYVLTLVLLIPGVIAVLFFAYKSYQNANCAINGCFMDNDLAFKNDNISNSTNHRQASQTAEIGESIQDGSIEFTVIKYECGIESVGTNQYNERRANGQFCLITVRVKNAGSVDKIFLSQFQLLVDNSNRQYNTDESAIAVLSNENYQIAGSSIKPGNYIEGVIVFDISKDILPESIELHETFGTKGVIVVL